MRGWRLLGLFWACVLLLVAAGVATLATLGPPPAPHPVAAGGAAPPRDRNNNTPWPGPPRPRPGDPVAPPQALLLEPAPDFPGAMLPRIGPGGRTPGRAYAAAADRADRRPKVALIVAGIGLDASDSQAATALPPPVDLAVSAYAENTTALLAAIRAAGHETLLSLPMQPRSYPGDDEGSHQLLTGASPAANARNLEWALSRIAGYAGVTGSSDGQTGDGYAASPALMQTMEQELARRGLFYIGAAGQAPPAKAPGRAADVVLDPGAIDGQLAALEHTARQSGAALAIAGRPTPALIARLARWTTGLNAAGIALVPVSALVEPAAAP